MQHLSDPEQRQILEARAARLAAIPEVLTPGQQRTVVCFEVGSAHYATDATHILEVSALVNCVPIPGTPLHVAGLVNQRGRLLTVLNLRSMLALPAANVEDAQLMTVSLDRQNSVGISVDSLSGVRVISQDELFMASELLQQLPPEIVAGVFMAEGQLTVLLDLPRLIASPQWIVEDVVR